MQTTEVTKNWAIDTDPAILQSIHTEDVDIAICQRDISDLSSEIAHLLAQKMTLKSSGSISSIMDELSVKLDALHCRNLLEDIEYLLQRFQEVTHVNSFRLLLSAIDNNMCRRFHTDMNDVRLLCTYSGPGTLWLKEDNINREALYSFEDNARIVLNESDIQQAETGAIVLLKGARYPQPMARAAVHRSPTIEESNEERLLLRIDTSEPVIPHHHRE